MLPFKIQVPDNISADTIQAENFVFTNNTATAFSKLKRIAGLLPTPQHTDLTNPPVILPTYPTDPFDFGSQFYLQQILFQRLYGKWALVVGATARNKGGVIKYSQGYWIAAQLMAQGCNVIGTYAHPLNVGFPDEAKFPPNPFINALNRTVPGFVSLDVGGKFFPMPFSFADDTATMQGKINDIFAKVQLEAASVDPVPLNYYFDAGNQVTIGNTFNYSSAEIRSSIYAQFIGKILGFKLIIKKQSSVYAVIDPAVGDDYYFTIVTLTDAKAMTIAESPNVVNDSCKHAINVFYRGMFAGDIQIVHPNINWISLLPISVDTNLANNAIYYPSDVGNVGLDTLAAQVRNALKANATAICAAGTNPACLTKTTAELTTVRQAVRSESLMSDVATHPTDVETAADNYQTYINSDYATAYDYTVEPNPYPPKL